MPFQCVVPWRWLSIQISERAFMHDMEGALRNVTLSVTPAAERRMRALIRHFRRDVLWRHPRSRVAENVLLEARRWRDRGDPIRGCCPLPDAINE